MTELENLMGLYQAFTPTTALYPKEYELLYLGLGLIDEREEWLESNYSIKEAGDIFWYCSQLCNYFSWDLYNIYQESGVDPLYPPRLAGGLKKYIRDNKDIKALVWRYMLNTLAEIKYRYKYFNSAYSLEETIKKIIILNRDKLVDRKNRGVIQGDGETVEERLHNKSISSFK